MTYADYLNLVEDRLADANISSSLPEVIERATNWGLRRMNRGQVSGLPRRTVGFDFQKQKTSVTFDSSTLAYSFTTLSITESTFKFPWDLRINTDENIFFDYVETTALRYKVGVLSSIQPMYALDNNGATKQLLISYNADDTLDFEYYTTHMVTDGTTRKASITDTSNDYFLFRDEYAESPLADYAAGYIIRNLESTDRQRGENLIKEGDESLLNMINIHGIYEKKPQTKLKIRSEWNNQYTRITKR